MHPVVSVGPFSKWGIDFMTYNPRSSGGHGYIIFTVDCFTKWVEAIPTFNNTWQKTAFFFFNHVIAWFGVPQAIFKDHGSHFRNHMMNELTSKLGLSHDSSTPYYPQSNGHIEVVNKILKWMIRVHKQNWHLILYSSLWAYRTSVRNTTGFTPFQLVYGLESIFPI